MLKFDKLYTAKEAVQPDPSKAPKQQRPPLMGVLRTGSPSSPSVSSGSAGSSERKVRFSDPEICEAADSSGGALQRASPSSNSAASTAHAPANSSSSNSSSRKSNGSSSSKGNGRPPRSPPTLPTVLSEANMGGAEQRAEQAQQQAQAQLPREWGRAEDAERHHDRHSHHSHSDHKQGQGQHHRHQEAPLRPPPEEVVAAAGDEQEGLPGCLADCARLFHKYKDPKKGMIGVDGFGCLLGAAGRLDSLRSPIARAAGAKREMGAADTNGDGWVDWQEFSAWFPSFQQQHYTQQRNHFYEEKGKEAEEAATAAAAAAAAAAKAAEEAAAAESAARRRRAILARAEARMAWEEAQAAAALKAAADAAVAAAGPETPPSAAARAAAAAATVAAAAGSGSQHHAAAGSPKAADVQGLNDAQVAAELQRLELRVAGAAAELAEAHARLAGQHGSGGGPEEASYGASGSTSSLSNNTPLPSPASGVPSSSSHSVAGGGTGAAFPSGAAAGGGFTQAPVALDSSKLQRQLQREALLLEATAAAAAADTAAAAAAVAEAAAAAFEAEEAAAVVDAEVAARVAVDPELQLVFAAFSAFGKNAQLQGTTALMPLLDSQQFAKLCRDTRLVGGGLTLAAADIIFARVAGKGGSRMTWHQFAAALPQLARKRGCSVEEAMQRLAACPGPQLNSEVGGTGRQSSFTGRSGSRPGSRPPSVVVGSEGGNAASDDGASADSRPGSTVGGFTPLRRPSQGGEQAWP